MQHNQQILFHPSYFIIIPDIVRDCLIEDLRQSQRTIIGIYSSVPNFPTMKKKSTRTLTNKKKSSRKGGKKNDKKFASVEELLQAADSAMTVMDVAQAVTLYSKAVAQLRNKISLNAKGDQNESAGVVSVKAETLQLLQALEKLGEAQVSMGEQDEARNHFQEAIQLLEEYKENQKRDHGSETEASTDKGDEEFEYHETRSSLYLYIGQLCSEQEALHAYQQGLKSLETCVRIVEEQQKQQLTKPPSSSVDENVEMHDNDESQTRDEYYRKLLPELQRKLAGAHCTVAELYLTDLCYEDNAESECETNLQRALQIKIDGEPIVDALQTMASLRLSQDAERRKEAVSYILQTYETMKKGSEALASLVGVVIANDNDDMEKQVGEGQAIELKEVDAATNLPEFEFRCQTAKLLLECSALLREDTEGTSNETSRQREVACINGAISVLGSLLAQNDEVVEVWYLMGCAYALAPEAASAARHYLERAKAMLLEIQKSLQQESEFSGGMDDDGEIEMGLKDNAAQLLDVQTKLDELIDEGHEPNDDHEMSAVEAMEE